LVTADAYDYEPSAADDYDTNTEKILTPTK
jgi:hypothetical protein